MTRRLTWPAVFLAVVTLTATRTADATEPGCPEGAWAIASHTGIETEAGAGRATVEFALADGCQDVQVTLASYQLRRTREQADHAAELLLFDTHSGRFDSGEIHRLSVGVMHGCLHQIRLLLGEAVPRYGPDFDYAEEAARTIDRRLEGGTQPCAGPVPRLPAAVTPAPPAAPTTTTPPAAPDPTTTTPRTTLPPAPMTTTPAPQTVRRERTPGPPVTTPATSTTLLADVRPVAPEAAAARQQPGGFPVGVLAAAIGGLVLLAVGVLCLARGRAGDD